MNTDHLALAVVIVAGLYVLAQIRLVRDTERLAVVRRGRFLQLRGPGMILAIRAPGPQAAPAG